MQNVTKLICTHTTYGHLHTNIHAYIHCSFKCRLLVKFE